jgi:flagellar hook-length control protein FliK
MQTPTLPIQISGASATPAPARANTPAADGAPQFSQALKRELDQRQNQVAPQAQAKAATPAKAQGPAKAAQAEPEQQAAQPEGKPDAAAVEDEGSAQATEAAAATPIAEMPVADMLALVASFNQPPQSPAAVAVAPQALPAAAAIAADPQALPAPAVGAAELPGAAAQTPELAVAGFAALAQNVAVPQPGAATEAVAATVAMPAAALPAATQPGAADAATGEDPALADIRQPAANPALTAAQAKAQPEPSQFASLRAREGAEPVALKETGAAAAPVSAPLQQASLAVAQAAGAVAADKIPARVGTPGWDHQVGQKIVWMVAGKEQSAALTLNPPDMGPLQVVLNVTNDQASVTFSSAQPEVRQALESAMPKLREMMSESGIELGNATVNAGMPDQRQAQGEQQRTGNGQGRSFETNGSAAEAAARNAARPAARGERQGLVDTFA